MGISASRERTSRHKNLRKLPSLKSQKSREVDLTASTLSKVPSSNPTTPPLTPPATVHHPTPVNLIKQQVVFPDYVSPQSSLSAVISIPVRRSSWRKSTNTNATHMNNDNIITTSPTSFVGDEDDDDENKNEDVSPRTSVGSEDHNTTCPKVEQVQRKKKSSPISFSSVKSNHKKEGTDIALESKLNNTVPSRISICSSADERIDPPKCPPRLLWSCANGDEREYDRQLRQHYVLKNVLDGNIHVPIPKDKQITILDAACGAGFWALDMAHAFPNAKIIGLDTFPSDDKYLKGYSSATISAPNIVYKYGDLMTHLSLPDNYIDVIYQRDTAPILPRGRWSFLFTELKRIMKPGGYIELVEHDFSVRNPGPVLALVNEWYKLAYTSVGVDPRQARRLKELLVSEGFEDVTRKIISVPIGEWPEDKAEREKGFLYKNVIKALFKSMRPWWIAALAVTEYEYDKVVTEALNELDEQRCSMDWMIYTARKPISSSTESHPGDHITKKSNSRTNVSFSDAAPYSY